MSPKFEIDDIVFVDNRYYKILSIEPLYSLKNQGNGRYGGYTLSEISRNTNMSVSDYEITNYKYEAQLVLNKNDNPPRSKTTREWYEIRLTPLDKHITDSVFALQARIDKLLQIQNFLRNE